MANGIGIGFATYQVDLKTIGPGFGIRRLSAFFHSSTAINGEGEDSSNPHLGEA